VTTPLEVLVTRANPEMEAPGIAMLDPQPLMEAEQSAAAEYLRDWSDRLSAKGYTVEYEHPAGHASAVIVERARQIGVDLIVMTTHGRSGLGRLIMGSVTEAVLRHTPCPVLVVRVSGDEPTATERAA
jgi:nucleotide-binding universal stress UspA family protein